MTSNELNILFGEHLFQYMLSHMVSDSLHPNVFSICDHIVQGQ